MSWITPFVSWISNMVPISTDLNRMEGNTQYLKDVVDAVRTLTLNGDVSATTTFDGYGDITLNITVLDNSHGHVSANLSDNGINLKPSSAYNSDRLGNRTPGNTSGDIPISNGTMNVNLNANLLYGYTPSNSSGAIPISNSTVCDTLNADLLDNHHGNYYAVASEVTSALSGKLNKPTDSAFTYFSIGNNSSYSVIPGTFIIAVRNSYGGNPQVLQYVNIFAAGSGTITTGASDVVNGLIWNVTV